MFDDEAFGDVFRYKPLVKNTNSGGVNHQQRRRTDTPACGHPSERGELEQRTNTLHLFSEHIDGVIQHSVRKIQVRDQADGLLSEGGNFYLMRL
jgi:hypothetical protein